MSKQISSLSVGLFATVQPFANGSQATSSVAAAAAKSQQDQLQVANQWLYRIEQNTRGSGNGMPIVSIAA